MVMPKVRLVLLILLQCSFAFADPSIGVDNYTYFGTTAEPAVLQWKASNGAVGYELRAYLHEQQIYIWIGSTTELTFTYQLPKSGHYTFMVRAVGAGDEFSTWSESTNPEVALVDEQPRAWWRYGYVAPPGPIIIK